MLALALLGDALIYAVLPLHVATFGVSLGWVGILLSANRFVRVFAYGPMVRIGARFGLRGFAGAATVAATVSTALYGLAIGPVPLLGARLLWGLAYAAFVLVTLEVAVQVRDSVGARVGWGRAIQRAGPVLALMGGGWLAGVLGPREVFLGLAVCTLLGLPFCFALPAGRSAAATSRAGPTRQGPGRGIHALGRPGPLDLIYCIQGFGVDGVFALSITLILARELSVEHAVFAGSALLAFRHLGEAIGAPVFGVLADRVGARRLFRAALALTVLGFLLVSFGLPVVGAVVMLSFRGAIAVLGPTVIVQDTPRDDPLMDDLARLQAWRDLGAALGPLATGYLLAVSSPETLHGICAAAMAAAWWGWSRARQGRRDKAGETP